jgi:membrane protein
VAKRYGDDGGDTWAAAIALGTLMALFPIALAILFVTSLALRDPGNRDAVLAQLARVLPPAQPGDTNSAFEQVRGALDGVRSSTGLLGAVSVLSLFWGGSALFSRIEGALAVIHRFERRTFVPQKLMAMGMILAYGVLTVIGIAASSALALITPVAEHAGVSDILGGPVRYLVQVAIGVGVGFTLFGLIYVVIPRPHRSLRQALPGTLFGAAGFELLTLLWPLYFSIAGRGMTRYGQEFGLLLVLVTYVYLLSQILIIGAVLNAMVAERRTAPHAAAQPQTTRHDAAAVVQPATPADTMRR